MSATSSGQHSPLFAEQGPCLGTGVETMDDSSFTTKIKIHGGLAAMQLVALLDADSPQTFISTHTFDIMKLMSDSSATCE